MVEFTAVKKLMKRFKSVHALGDDYNNVLCSEPGIKEIENNM